MDLSITNIKRAARVAFLMVFLTLAPVAFACPVCSSNRAAQSPRASRAMLGTTAAMAVLPLGMLAGLVWWLRKNL